MKHRVLTSLLLVTSLAFSPALLAAKKNVSGTTKSAATSSSAKSKATSGATKSRAASSAARSRANSRR